MSENATSTALREAATRLRRHAGAPWSSRHVQPNWQLAADIGAANHVANFNEAAEMCEAMAKHEEATAPDDKSLSSV